MTSVPRTAAAADPAAVPVNWLQAFAPGWFAAVMGTGALVLALLAALWLVTLVKTLRGVASGALLRPQ